MLLLFDIDGTLLVTKGSGMRSMGDAGRELFGPTFDESKTSFAGRLDPLIFADLFRENNIPATPENSAALRAAYRRHLEPKLALPGTGRALPGVHALLSRVASHERVTMGLLTGNFCETGRLKLRACGIDPEQFEIAVWGDHSPHDPPARSHLPAIGLERYRRKLGKDVPSAHATIIGDTPFDVACALANGCRCLGVATGQFSVAQLRDAGAHHVVSDLTDTEVVATWLVGNA